MSDGNVTPFRPGKPKSPLEGYLTAVGRQRADRIIAAGKIVPARITIALDMRGLEGPEVDIACDAAEPDVDMWELGLSAPTDGQLEKLAMLTGFQVAFFYQPLKPGPLTGPVFVCYERHGEVIASDVITEDGVLLYGGQPRDVPAAVQGKLF